MTISETSVEEFLERLASSAATPGGGSAAALMGAMGAALTSMVCNVSIGKKGMEGLEAEMAAVRGESEVLRGRLTAMMTADIEAFDALMAAYKLPKISDAEKAARSMAIQQSMQRATEVPLQCARACAEIIALARRAGDHGYQGVVSDAGVGVLAAHAALRSAALNVYINAPALKDKAFAERCVSEIDTLVASSGAATDAVYAVVRGRL